MAKNRLSREALKHRKGKLPVVIKGGRLKGKKEATEPSLSTVSKALTPRSSFSPPKDSPVTIVPRSQHMPQPRHQKSPNADIQNRKSTSTLKSPLAKITLNLIRSAKKVQRQYQHQHQHQHYHTHRVQPPKLHQKQEKNQGQHFKSSTNLEIPELIELRPTETKPVETKQVETTGKRLETKLDGAKLVEVKPVETKPVEAKRLEIRAIKSISSRASDFYLDRLARDGRKPPDHYKQVALKVSSPSELSVKMISEHYVLQKGSPFVTADDVFQYRGYKKMNKIDEGAFGIVSKAIRLTDNLVVAVKEVDLRKKKAKRIEEMKRELFMLQQIESDNVVKLIEHFIIGQMLVIIMEFCAGSNLTTYLKEVAIDEAEAKFLFRQMAFSLKVLHKKGFAHRDVKLNNFLLDATRKHIKIGDFGLSVVSFKKNEGILMAKTYCGTEPYMAPEILRRNSYGIRSYNPIYSDIWSLGVCLFAMLTRTFPFRMQTSQEGIFKAQTARKWRFPRSLREILSEEIKDLVWHMLDPEPERRVTINNVLAHPWLNQNELVVMSTEDDDGHQ